MAGKRLAATQPFINTMDTNPHTLTIAGKTYRSRLLVGTGKYKDFAETRAAIDADDRLEERRVGKECRSRWSPYH